MMDKKGFTLIELQVASLITLITVIAVISLYIFSWRSFTIGNTLLDVYSNSRNASGWLMRDVRCAAQIEPSCTSDGTTYTTSDNVIVLMVPSIDASGNVISSRYDHIIYRLQGSDLYRIVRKDSSSSRPNENRVVARYCTSLTFSSVAGGVAHGLSYYANNGTLDTLNTVGISLPLNKTTVSLSGAGETTEWMTPTTVARLRNK